MDLQVKVALVTGANGFVGHYAVRRLLQEGMRVRAIVRRPEAAGELTAMGVETVLGDVTSAEDCLKAAQGANLIVHCAATPNPDLTEARKVNVDATRCLLDAAKAAGVERFIHISTGGVYKDERPPVLDESYPLVEEGSTYAVTKAEADMAVFAAAAQGLKAAILRPTIILGIHPTSTWGSKVPRAIASGKFKLAAGGMGAFNYVHVENLAEAIVLAARNDQSSGKAYNVNDGCTTWKAYADHFRTGDLPDVPAAEAPVGLLWTGQFSNEKIVRELGYRPVCNFEAAMAQTRAYIGG